MEGEGVDDVCLHGLEGQDDTGADERHALYEARVKGTVGLECEGWTHDVGDDPVYVGSGTPSYIFCVIIACSVLWEALTESEEADG